VPAPRTQYRNKANAGQVDFDSPDLVFANTRERKSGLPHSAAVIQVSPKRSRERKGRKRKSSHPYLWGSPELGHASDVARETSERSEKRWRVPLDWFRVMAL
jgi:hypothetical protein